MPCNGVSKELKIHSSTSWAVAHIKFGEKMICDPAKLKLAYHNPFKPQGNRKPIPTSLETEEEWKGLLDHVKKHEQAEMEKKTKNKVLAKSYVIELVELSVGNEEPKGKNTKKLASAQQEIDDEMRQQKKQGSIESWQIFVKRITAISAGKHTIPIPVLWSSIPLIPCHSSHCG